MFHVGIEVYFNIFYLYILIRALDPVMEHICTNVTLYYVSEIARFN